VHRQLKAFLRGDACLPFGDGRGSIVEVASEGTRTRVALQRASQTYWRLEYFKRWAGVEAEAVCLDPGKVLLVGLGAICDYKGSAPLSPGDKVTVTLAVGGDVV